MKDIVLAESSARNFCWLASQAILDLESAMRYLCETVRFPLESAWVYPSRMDYSYFELNQSAVEYAHKTVLHTKWEYLAPGSNIELLTRLVLRQFTQIIPSAS